MFSGKSNTLILMTLSLYKYNYLGGTGFIASKLYDLCHYNTLHARIKKFPKIVMVIFKET